MPYLRDRCMARQSTEYLRCNDESNDMTAQVHERLILDGKHTTMTCCPPVRFAHPRLVIAIHKKPDLIIGSSACWRGYVGSWELKQGKLYLIGVRGHFEISDGQPIFAEWVTGVLRVPQGRQLMYVHMGFESVYAKDLYIQIVNGVETKRCVIDNRGFPHLVWWRKLLQSVHRPRVRRFGWHRLQDHTLLVNEFNNNPW
jgi:hypothetical protein